MFAITYTTCGFYLSNPFYPFMILLFFVTILLLIKNKIIRLITSVLFLGIQLALDVMFIFLYDSNGTVFEWAMFNQRTDAFGTLETYDLQYGYLFICVTVILIPAIYLFIKYFKDRNNQNGKMHR